MARATNNASGTATVNGAGVLEWKLNVAVGPEPDLAAGRPRSRRGSATVVLRGCRGGGALRVAGREVRVQLNAAGVGEGLLEATRGAQAGRPYWGVYAR